jgi:hypothetical protein
VSFTLIKVKAAIAMPNPFKTSFRLVGLLLMFIFIGRVGLVSVYGYAGVHKPATNITSDSGEQENNDNKEEGKYAEKQFKCFAPMALVNLVPVYVLTVSLNHGQYTPHYTAVNCLTVLTPPPNC